MATENGFLDLVWPTKDNGEERDDVEPIDYECNRLSRSWHMCRADEKCIMKVVGKRKTTKGTRNKWGCVLDDGSIS